LRPRRHPALQPALRNVEEEHEPVLATRGHFDESDLFRMRTIYATPGGLSRRFLVACAANHPKNSHRK
jgi:hypothetical protein